jgi:hypothetical protein
VKETKAQESRAEAQPSASSRLASSATTAARLSDAVAATIGHARAELREISALLAAPTPRPVRRRPRLTTVLHPTDSLFPS